MSAPKRFALQTAIVTYAFLVLYVTPFIAGYFWGSTFRANKKAWWIGIILNLAFEGLLIFALWDRYSAVGTREEFLQGATVVVSDFHLLGVLLNGGGIPLVILGVWQ